MHLIHTIRLKGPWNYTWLDQAGQNQPAVTSGRVQAPVSWKDCFGSLSGCVRWTRRFQRPTNLDSDERVLLSLAGVRGIERVCLNQTVLQMFLTDKFDRKYDLTDGLLPTNLIEIDTRHSGPDDPRQSGLWCSVELQIWSIGT